MKTRMRQISIAFLSAIGLLAATGSLLALTLAQTLSGSALVAALRQGGYVM